MMLKQPRDCSFLKRYGCILGGGFNYFICSPLFGEDFHFD